MEVENLFGRLNPQKQRDWILGPCVADICLGKIGYAINWIRLTPEITGKHSQKYLKNAENKNLLKIKK